MVLINLLNIKKLVLNKGLKYKKISIHALGRICVIFEQVLITKHGNLHNCRLITVLHYSEYIDPQQD